MQDRPELEKDERNARLLRLLGAIAPVAGAGIGAVAGGLLAGPGGGLAGAQGGAFLGHGLGAVTGGLANFGATETMAPNTQRELSKEERLMQIMGALRAGR